MADHPRDRRLELLLEHCGEFVTLADRDGRLVEQWSPTGDGSLGYALEEVRGLRLLDFVHPEDIPSVEAAFESVLAAADAVVGFRCRVRSKDNEWRQLEGTLTNRLSEPLLAGIVINWRDVTELRQYERRAAQAEEMLAHIFEEAPIGMVIASIDRVIRRVNPALCSSLGYTREELLSLDPHALVHPEDYERVLGEVKPVREGEIPVLRTEARFQGKDGRVAWMDVSAFYLRDESGRAERVVALLHDITEEKEAKAELEASRDRIRQLARFVVEAREQERATIAREIHDELGQLLTALLMEVDQLRHDHREDCPNYEWLVERAARLREYAREAMDWVQRMAVELRPGILRHLGLVEAIQWQAERFEQDTGIRCRLELPLVDLELAESQATTVFRILQEALTNTARHSRARQVIVRLYTVGDRVVLTVKDDGKGLPASLAGNYLAVGLAGMRERAEQHGGRLRFFSKPGLGVTVALRLPRSLPKHLDISANL